MKDTYCTYCNPPYFSIPAAALGFTNSSIVAQVDEKDSTLININVFHERPTDDTLIYDGSFSLKATYCPMCGRKLNGGPR